MAICTILYVTVLGEPVCGDLHASVRDKIPFVSCHLHDLGRRVGSAHHSRRVIDRCLRNLIPPPAGQAERANV